MILEKNLQKVGRVGSNTEYVIALIPIGGYVKMACMLDESMDGNIKYENSKFEDILSVQFLIWIYFILFHEMKFYLF